MYTTFLFKLCLKDKKIKMLICTNIYFTPLCIKYIVYLQHSTVDYMPTDS